MLRFNIMKLAMPTTTTILPALRPLVRYEGSLLFFVTPILQLMQPTASWKQPATLQPATLQPLPLSSKLVFLFRSESQPHQPIQPLDGVYSRSSWCGSLGVGPRPAWHSYSPPSPPAPHNQPRDHHAQAPSPPASQSQPPSCPHPTASPLATTAPSPPAF